MKLTTAKVRGRTKHVVDCRVNGKGKRHSFTNKSEAERCFTQLSRTHADGSRVWRRLNKSEQEELIEIYFTAKSAGHDLITLVRNAKPGDANAPKLKDVIAELIQAKTNAGRDKDYLRGLKSVLKQFAKGRESACFNALHLSDVERFLDSFSINYRSTLRARLSTLFKFGIRRGYRTDNPCARLEVVTVTRKPPHVFTVVQTESALKWLMKNQPHGLAWFVLTTTCGLRPEEAEKTVPKRDINFKEGYVKVEAQTTKVRQRRVVYPKREAMTLLKWALKHGGRLPLSNSSRDRLIAGETKKRKWKPTPGKERKFKTDRVKITKQGLRHALGFEAWPKDITRHTAASFWLADCGSAVVVSEALGNSERVLLRDYKAVVTRAEAKEFWAMVKRMAATTPPLSAKDSTSEV